MVIRYSGFAVIKKFVEVEVPSELSKEIKAWCEHYGLSLDEFLSRMAEGKCEFKPLTAEDIRQAIHTH